LNGRMRCRTGRDAPQRTGASLPSSVELLDDFLVRAAVRDRIGIDDE